MAYARLTSPLKVTRFLPRDWKKDVLATWEKLFTTTTSAHSRLSLLLNNNNKAWCFVGKLAQVIISSYVLGTFHGIKNINVRKWNIVRVRPSSAVKFEFRAFADDQHHHQGWKINRVVCNCLPLWPTIDRPILSSQVLPLFSRKIRKKIFWLHKRLSHCDYACWPRKIDSYSLRFH